MDSRIGTLAAAAALALGLAIPAHAIEVVTGTYEGKLSCKGYAGGTPSKSKRDVTIELLEADGLLARVTVAGAPLGNTIQALGLEDAVKDDRAKIQGLDCDSTVDSPQSLTIEGDLVVKPGSEKGSLKGSLIHRNAGGMPSTIDVCTFTTKRTTVAPPVLTPCPPEA